MGQPTRAGVLRAADKMAEILAPTPLLPVEIDGVQCWVKAESLQPIGAFKIRGAWNRISELPEDERRPVWSACRAATTRRASPGRRGGWAFRRPSSCRGRAAREDRQRAGARRRNRALRPPGAEDRDAIAQAIRDETGATLVHAFADPWVIEGQGSAGIETAAQLAERGLAAPTRSSFPAAAAGFRRGWRSPAPMPKSCPSSPSAGT